MRHDIPQFQFGQNVEIARVNITIVFNNKVLAAIPSCCTADVMSGNELGDDRVKKAHRDPVCVLLVPPVKNGA